jgi:hypothetical protein
MHVFSRRSLIRLFGWSSVASVAVPAAEGGGAAEAAPAPSGLAEAIAATRTTEPAGLAGVVETRPFLDKLNDAVSLFDFPGATAERAKPEAEQDWAPVLELALNACAAAGRTLRIPVLGHPYWLRSISSRRIGTKADHAVAVSGNHLSVDQEPGAVLTADPEAFDGLTVTNLIGAMTEPYPGPADSFFEWRNLRMDMSGVDTAGSGVSALDLSGFNSVVLERPYGDLGTKIPTDDEVGTGGTDTFGGTHACNNIHVTHPVVSGAYDAAWYLSGNNDGGNIRDGIGERATILGGDYYRCSNTVTAKRDFLDFKHFGGSWFECGNGVASGAARGRDNHGRAWTLIGLQMRKMRGRPIALTKGVGDIVQDCRIFDYGLRPSDQAPTKTSISNPLAAIGLRGAVAPNVGGNVCGFVDWRLPPQARNRRGPYGIIFGRHSHEGATFETVNGLALGNILFGMFRGELESPDRGRNNIFRNHVLGTVEPSAIGGAGSCSVPLATVRLQADKGGRDQANVLPDTLVTFANIARNVGGFFDAASSRFAPSLAGDYAIRAQVLVAEGMRGRGQLILLHIRRNGVPVATASQRSLGGAFVHVAVACDVAMDGLDDVVDVVLSHDGAAGVTISGAPADTFFSASLIQ